MQADTRKDVQAQACDGLHIHGATDECEEESCRVG